MTKLSPTMRTLLKNRLNRHHDGLQIAEYIQGSSWEALNFLKAPQLLELAERFKVQLVSREDADEYDKLRANGVKFKDAISQLEAPYRANGLLANIATVEQGVPVIAGGGGQVPLTEAELEADQDEDQDQDQGATQDQDEDEKRRAAAIDRDVANVLTAAGTLDRVKIRAAVQELAERANRPDPEPVQIMVQAPAPGAAGSKRRLANRLAAKTMTQAGIKAPVLNVLEDLTKLPVYDAKDRAVDPGYIWPDDTGPMLAALADGRHLLLTGERGTGKTVFAEQVAARFGRPFVRISCDETTDAPQLIGMTLGKDENHAGVWQDGQLAMALRIPGCVILIDEPTAARPGALMALHAVLDDGRALSVPETGEVIPLASDVLVILADNTNGRGDQTGQYEATRIVNAATLDRVALTVTFRYLDIADETRALEARAKVDRRLASAICKWASLTRRAADAKELSTAVSFRRLVELAGAIRRGAGATWAFNNAVLGSANFEDVEKLRQLWLAEFNATDAGCNP